jgi:FkbM family methyltransferase
MVVISWAGHGEDQILRRFLSKRPQGTYVDIGAAHPKFGSVTYAIYELGWRGVAIEPRQEVFNQWVKLRQRDFLVTSALTVAGIDGYMSNEGFRSHFSKNENLNSKKKYVQVKSISTLQLIDVIKEKLVEVPTFIKIDIEGLEFEIVKSLLYQKMLPELWIIEVIDQFGSEHIRRENSGKMKTLMKSFDYKLVLFDGVNEWYLKESSEAIHRNIWSPAYPGVEEFIPFHLTTEYRVRNFIHSYRQRLKTNFKKVLH